MFNFRRLQDSDFTEAARELGVETAVIRAVTSVEARGSGFISGTDLPLILFEGHIFHRLTGGRYSSDYPGISYPRWDRGKYKGSRGEYDRLTLAIRVHAGNPEPALMSASWGLFQIMGFNHAKAGFGSVVDFVNTLSSGEPAQLMAFVTYLKATGLADTLREREWATFARAYNGAGYRANRYDTKLAAAFARERMRRQDDTDTEGASERADAVELQVALNAALGGTLTEKLATDGWIGDKTRLAIRLFQRSKGLAETGEDSPELRVALGLVEPVSPKEAA